MDEELAKLMFNNILVVCVGNICRSPTGERLLKDRLPGKKVSSAGISALVGHSADEQAFEVAREHNIDLTNHIARQVTSKMCRDSDLILVMEKGHIDAITQICPEVRGKTMLFGHWLKQIEIPDPYRRSNELFEHVFQLLDEAAGHWVKMLTK